MVCFVAIPAVECSRITFLLKPSMALYENIKTVQNSDVGLAWLCRCQKIQMHYRMHEIIPGAEAKEPVCPTTWNCSFQARR